MDKSFFSIELLCSSGSWVGVVNVPENNYGKPEREVMRTWERYDQPEDALHNCLDWVNKQ